LVLGRQLLGAVLHSSNEPGELSQWLCDDNSTTNIVLELLLLLLLLLTQRQLPRYMFSVACICSFICYFFVCDDVCNLAILWKTIYSYHCETFR